MQQIRLSKISIMKIKHSILTIILLLFSSTSIYAQSEQTDSVNLEFTPYGSFLGHLAAYDKKTDLQDNVTHFGANVRIKKDKISFLAAAEVHFNLFQGGGNFNVNGNTNGQFLQVQTLTNTQTFTNRLGYMGIDFEKYGTITFGKQKSIYYDITAYTNDFTVFGGRASATFIGGTDGGDNGTGRANQAIIYRNKIDKFSIGAQMLARGSNNKKFIDGYGFSGQYELTKEITWGAAFNRALYK